MTPGESVEILLSTEQINARVHELADEINRDYGDKPVTLVCALSGGMMLLADLARKLGDNIAIDFVRASSYGDETVSSGTVKLDSPPRLPVEGKDVLIVEDIIDTGYTITYLRNYLEEAGAASVRVCALLDKPARREVADAKADYLGFSIPDEFVVGYGLDYAQRYRNLPYVGILRFNQ